MMDASNTILPAKHRACIIAVYLGKFPGWFSVWLRSCEMNPGFDFLLLTDRPNDLPFRPANLRVEQTTLKQLKDRFSAAVGFEVALNYAFKICDFRPVFGLAFADLLKNNDFWGHTDLDLYFGNLAAFITDEMLDKYVRLYHRGHMSLYRNDGDGNSLYRLPHPTVDYRQVFLNEDYCYFDEYLGIEKLMSHNKVPEFENNYAFADIVPRSPDFRLTRKELNHPRQAFLFEDGRMQQVFLQDGEIRRRDFMYVHLQKRVFPDLNPSQWRNLSRWVVTPQGFVPGGPEIWSEAELLQFNKPNYGHTIRHVWRRAKRRLNAAASRKTS